MKKERKSLEEIIEDQGIEIADIEEYEDVDGEELDYGSEQD